MILKNDIKNVFFFLFSDENTFNWTKYLLLGEQPLEIGANIVDSDLEDVK